MFYGSSDIINHVNIMFLWSEVTLIDFFLDLWMIFKRVRRSSGIWKLHGSMIPRVSQRKLSFWCCARSFSGRIGLAFRRTMRVKEEKKAHVYLWTHFNWNKLTWLNKVWKIQSTIFVKCNLHFVKIVGCSVPVQYRILYLEWSAFS